jgi:hypothetical protein
MGGPGRRKPTPTIGRVEERRHFVSYDVDWLFSSRRYAHQARFPHLAMIAMVKSRVERNSELARERRYCLSSAKLDPEVFALAVRTHWGVEHFEALIAKPPR